MAHCRIYEYRVPMYEGRSIINLDREFSKLMHSFHLRRLALKRESFFHLL